MGVARCNKSTGDMLAACHEKYAKPAARNQKRTAASNAARKFEQLKQTSLSYLMLGPAGRHFSRSNKSLASSEEESEETDGPAPGGRREPLLAERFGIELDDWDELTQRRTAAEPRASPERKNARSSCYIWLAEHEEQAGQPAARVDCHPSERHIRLALSSPMLHESLSRPAGRCDLEQFARPPALESGERASCQSLAEAASKSVARRRPRQRHKVAASQEARNRRRRHILCDTDSDPCESAELHQAAAASRGQRQKAQHHARSAANLALMLHNCETIDAEQRSAATPVGAAQAQEWRHSIVALDGGERQFATGLGELPSAPESLQQASAQPGQRRGRPTSSAGENNAERPQGGSAGAADKLAGGQLPASSACISERGGGVASGSAWTEPRRALGGQEQEQEQGQARDGVGVELEEWQLSSCERASRDMGVDVIEVVNQLVGTCVDSWRRSQNSLLGSYSGSAGSYKVAQLARGAAETAESRLRGRPEQEQEVARDTLCDSGKQAPATSRLSRPGRSPVSLQRQTNARLARHRLKIQQQRQEQLASLALREREQFHYRDFSSLHHNQAGARFCSTTSFQRPTSQRPDHTEIEILESELASGQGRRSSLDYCRELIGRLPAPFKSSRRQSREFTVAPHHQDSSDATRLPLARLTGDLWPRARARSLAERSSEFAASSSSSAQSVLTIEPSPLQRAINANISSRTRRQRDLAQVLAQANVIVHRSPNDLLRDARGAACGASSRHDQQRAQGQSGASRGESRAQQQAQQHQFRFQYRHMAAEQEDAKCGPGGQAEDARSNSADSSASSTLSLNKPFCKICHLSSSRHGDKLISPCKCAGTMQYVHCSCLLKWLEISNRTNEKQPMSCELCAHEYTWHKRFNVRQMKLPKCSLKDILLHSIFVLALGVMMFCALAPMFNTTRAAVGHSGSTSSSRVLLSSQAFGENSADEAKLSSRGAVTFGDDAPGSLMSTPGRRSPLKSSTSSPIGASRLANDEKFILLCAAVFFVSFFIAIYAQTKARDTLYGLIVKFANMNLTYYITEYDHGQQQQQQQQAAASNKSHADCCNSLCNPTDSNHADLTHCQPPAPAAFHEAARPGQTHGRHRGDYSESPASGRNSKRT